MYIPACNLIKQLPKARINHYYYYNHCYYYYYYYYYHHYYYQDADYLVGSTKRMTPRKLEKWGKNGENMKLSSCS